VIFDKNTSVTYQQKQILAGCNGLNIIWHVSIDASTTIAK